MVADSEGFLRPKVSDACVKCGMCVKVCPAGKIKDPPRPDIKYYYGYSLDDETRLASSSGGIFTEFAKAFIEGGGCVCGAHEIDAALKTEIDYKSVCMGPCTALARIWDLKNIFLAFYRRIQFYS